MVLGRLKRPYSGRSAARSARLLREQEVGGSNPPAPTKNTEPYTPTMCKALVLRSTPDCLGRVSPVLGKTLSHQPRIHLLIKGHVPIAAVNA